MRLKLLAVMLAGASSIALAPAALAQETPEAAEAQQEGSPETISNTTVADRGLPGGADDAAAAGDIVVTATRRTERLQDVPLAVSAISGDQLAEAGFQNLADIQYQFSGVQFGWKGFWVLSAILVRYPDGIVGTVVPRENRNRNTIIVSYRIRKIPSRGSRMNNPTT